MCFASVAKEAGLHVQWSSSTLTALLCPRGWMDMPSLHCFVYVRMILAKNAPVMAILLGSIIETIYWVIILTTAASYVVVFYYAEL